MKAKMLAVVLCLFTFSIARSQEYFSVTTAANGDVWYITEHTIEDGFGFKMWVKVENKSLTLIKATQKRIYKNAYMVALYHFNCERQVMGLLEWIYYDSKDQVIGSGEGSGNSTVVPNSVGHKMLSSACILRQKDVDAKEKRNEDRIRDILK